MLIMVASALDEPIKQGKVVATRRVYLARSNIGMVVRTGAPKPDISSVETFKHTLLEAKSTAYSDSASGVDLSAVLFPQLAVSGKSRKIPAEPVGTVVGLEPMMPP